MSTLRNNWFCDGIADFEYKKYLLLAYLQYVNRHFKDTRLYPSLGELVSHHRNLHHFLDSKRKMDEGFPTEMEGIDIHKLRLAYKSVLQDDNILETIEHLVQYAAPKIKSYLDNGKEIYEFIEDQLAFEPVGVVPLRKEEGYLILAGKRKDYLVYNYVMSLFSSATDSYRSIQTQFVKSYKKNIINTFSNIKTDLIRKRRNLPNPATYVVRSDINIPVKETFLPIAKKMLVVHLAKS